MKFENNTKIMDIILCDKYNETTISYFPDEYDEIRYDLSFMMIYQNKEIVAMHNVNTIKMIEFIDSNEEFEIE